MLKPVIYCLMALGRQFVVGVSIALNLKKPKRDGDTRLLRGSFLLRAGRVEGAWPLLCAGPRLALLRGSILTRK